MIFIIVAPVTGIVTGLVLARLRFQYLLLVLYHTPYRFWRSYSELYEEAETTFTYEMIGSKKFKNSKDFLVQYRKLKPRIETRFKRLWDKYAYFVVRDYGIVLAASGLLFFYYYLAFIVPFVLVQLGYLVYTGSCKRYDLELFTVLMLSMLFQAGTE
jgi:hypothetical protein